MSHVETITERVRHRVDALNGEVVAAALARLEEGGAICSYRKYLPEYLDAMANVTHLERQLEWVDDTCRTVLRDKSAAAKQKMALIHIHLYDNPCRTCVTCRTRRKQWPESAPLPSLEQMFNRDEIL